MRKKDISVLEKALKNIEKAAVEFERVKDFAGSGVCFNKIGLICETSLKDIERACLFYRQAIESYNKAILRNHPLRKSMWAKPELIMKRIIELKNRIEELLPNLDNLEIQKKVKEELNSIEYNF